MKIILFIAGLLIVTEGCLQEEYRVDLSDNRVLREAEIVYYGAPEACGCGWLIRVGDVFFHPENLADHFKTENLPVLTEYIETREIYKCNRGGTSYKTIRILKIESQAIPMLLIKQ